MATPGTLTIESSTTKPTRIADQSALRRPPEAGTALSQEGTTRSTGAPTTGPPRQMSMPYQSLHHTLRSMGRLARQAVEAGAVESALEATLKEADVSPSAGPDQVAKAVWRWVRDNVIYRRDEAGTEYLKGPVAILRAERPAEDCDGQAMLAAAMMETAGIRAGFRAVAQQERETFNHVYAIYRSPSGWKGLDPTINRPPQGDLHQSIVQKDLPLSTMEVTTESAPVPKSQSSVDLAAAEGRAGMGQSDGSGQFWHTTAAGEDIYDVDGGGGTTATGRSVAERITEDILQVLPKTVTAFKGGDGNGGGQRVVVPDGGGGGTNPVKGGRAQRRSSIASTPLVVGGGLVALGLLGYAVVSK